MTSVRFWPFLRGTKHSHFEPIMGVFSELLHRGANTALAITVRAPTHRTADEARRNSRELHHGDVRFF